MNPAYPAVATRARHRCEYCRAPEEIFNFRFEIEHVAPQAAGGSDDVDNLALACRACNAYKSVFVTGIDPESRREVYLFNPRKESWQEHFQFDLQTYTIQGRTACGRATVERLCFNEDYQCAARVRWVLLELFP